MIKLIATDMDGTLLNNKHKLGKIEEKMIQDIIKNNHHFSLATGRSLKSIKLAIKNLKNMNIIALNGSYAQNFKGEVVYQKSIKNDVLKNVIEILLSNRVTFLAHNIEETFCNNKKDYYIRYFKWTKNLSMLLNIMSRFKTFKGIEKDIYKIDLFTSDTDVIDKLKQIAEINFVSSGNDGYEITDIEASKKDALIALSKHLNIQEDNVYCFGDSGNDISMINYFKNGYLMGNAEQHFKEMVEKVIDTNENNGIYKIISKEIKI